MYPIQRLTAFTKELDAINVHLKQDKRNGKFNLSFNSFADPDLYRAHLKQLFKDFKSDIEIYFRRIRSHAQLLELLSNLIETFNSYNFRKDLNLENHLTEVSATITSDFIEAFYSFVRIQNEYHFIAREYLHELQKSAFQYRYLVSGQDTEQKFGLKAIKTVAQAVNVFLTETNPRSKKAKLNALRKEIVDKADRAKVDLFETQIPFILDSFISSATMDLPKKEKDIMKIIQDWSWTATKADFLELMLALHELDIIKNGDAENLSRSDLIENFAIILGISNINDAESRISRMGIRSEPTSFINKLRNAVDQYYYRCSCRK